MQHFYCENLDLPLIHFHGENSVGLRTLEYALVSKGRHSRTKKYKIQNQLEVLVTARNFKNLSSGSEGNVSILKNNYSVLGMFFVVAKTI